MKTAVKTADRFLQDCIEEVKSNWVARINRGRRQLHSHELHNSRCSKDMWLIKQKKTGGQCT